MAYSEPKLENWVEVATVGDLSEGDMVGLSAGDVELCLALIEGEYFAISNVCSHVYALLTDGDLFVEEREVQCPLHESAFSLVDGEPTCPPADEPVPAYAVRVEGNVILVGPRD